MTEELALLVGGLASDKQENDALNLNTLSQFSFFITGLPCVYCEKV